MSSRPDQLLRQPYPAFRAGDLVTPVRGYPILYEIVCLERDALVRVRGLDWPSGYTAVVRVEEVRHVTGLLAY